MIQIAGRLIGKDQRRARGQRAGNRHALLLPARKLRRIVPQPVPEAHRLQRRPRARSRLALPRQLADQGGWYDLGENAFKLMEDAYLLAAMGPPGGGRNAVSSRLLRHFNLLCFTDFNEDTMKHIFSTVMTWYFSKNTAYAGDVVRLGVPVVAATLDVYRDALSGRAVEPRLAAVAHSSRP